MRRPACGSYIVVTSANAACDAGPLACNISDASALEAMNSWQPIPAMVPMIFYVLEDNPIKSVSDLVGKTVAVNTLGTHRDYTVCEVLQQNGLPENPVDLVTAPDPHLKQVLRAKQVDVAGFG